MDNSDLELGEAFDRPDYRPRLLHLLLVLSSVLGRISPLALTPAWLALAAIASWPWQGLRLAAAAVSLTVILVDGLALALLPRMQRSFGPVTPPLLALACVRTALTFVAGLLWASQLSLVILTGIQLAIAAASVYATWIEPFRIGVTRADLRSPKLNAEAPLRLLHITDLHVERITRRERRLLDLVERLDPDIVVLTGDYLNLSSVRDPQAQEEARALLSGLCDRARGPVYAVTGSPPVDLAEVVPSVFEDLPITWLLDEIVELNINGHVVRLAGLRCLGVTSHSAPTTYGSSWSGDRSGDSSRLRRLLQGRCEETFTLLLYHSPDLMPEALELGVDLYLCGHTHGGQIRLPLFGALVTSSDFWKRYEMGRYEENGTTLYVSRGLGMEGVGAPRARFLAPPEIVLWTLSSNRPSSFPKASSFQEGVLDSLWEGLGVI